MRRLTAVAGELCRVRGVEPWHPGGSRNTAFDRLRDELGCTGLADDDQEAVRKLFKLLQRFTSETPNMQVIVSDHVELLDDWFRDAIAERWRDGIALIPASWLQE